MKEKEIIKINAHKNEEVDLLYLFQIILKEKLTVFLITVIFSVIAIVYSLQLPNIYKSEAVLVPVESSNDFSGSLGGYSGLASIAGVGSFSSGVADTNAEKAIKKVNTLSFFETNILPNIFLPELMAVKSWNPKSNQLIFDSNLYDVENDKWNTVASNSQHSLPSAQSSFRKFKSEHLEISNDVSTGFITISIKHESPHVAKNWAELLINQINSFYREQDREAAERAVEFLNSLMVETNFTEIKQAIAVLLQQETQKLTLIEVYESYVFEYIDPPAVMERKHEPRRSIICIFGAIIGLLIGIFFVIIRRYK